MYNYNSFLIFFTVPPTYLPPSPDPCVPSPCGPNSLCKVQNNLPVCTCHDSYIGQTPSCRPECTTNEDCSRALACTNMKCRDPCPGSCGLNAECRVSNHIPNCICKSGYIGDPFTACYHQPRKYRSTFPPNRIRVRIACSIPSIYLFVIIITNTIK